MADGAGNPHQADERAQRRGEVVIARETQSGRLNAVINYIDTPDYMRYTVFQPQARLDRFRSVFANDWN